MSGLRFAGCYGLAKTVSVATLIALFGAGAAVALEAGPKEEENLKACERSVCEIILTKKTSGDRLTCDLQKTWAEGEISEGADKKSLSWGLGDAQCKLDLDVPQADLVNALTEAEFNLALPKHPVNCAVQDAEGETTKVSLSLAPNIEFKDGKAVSGTIGIDDIEGPTLFKGAIWTVASLESSLGLFESDLLREVNKFVAKKCAKRYPDIKAAE